MACLRIKIQLFNPERQGRLMRADFRRFPGIASDLISYFKVLFTRWFVTYALWIEFLACQVFSDQSKTYFYVVV